MFPQIVISVMTVIVLASLVLDYLETLYIAVNPTSYYEKWNKLLGQHPSAAKVHAWFCSWLLVAAVLPTVLYRAASAWIPEYEGYVELAILTIMFAGLLLEVAAISDNVSIGIPLFGKK